MPRPYPEPGQPDWASRHRALYLSSGGTAGHVMDLRPVGGHRFTTHCLLRLAGRRTGRTVITPLIYGAAGGEVLVVASNGGSDRHPAWYRNLRAHPTLRFQIATQAFEATWREPEAPERQRLWDFMVALFPPYATYRAATDRRIPLVALRAVAAAPVFAVQEETHHERLG
ncbi:nitroreductase/quinone reductase family protein [Nocardia sp. NPDC050697]|uniref:nitroreductase/quinone reductase family protein n=1 Tax=Nocardia sp. NPDC050697 TaxID=3155158 RepID=UPI0033CC74CA